MKIHPAIVVAAAVVLVTAAAAIGIFTLILLQGSAVLLELIAHSLEETP